MRLDVCMLVPRVCTLVLFILLQTWFIGECGSDTGGVTHELWRLFGNSVMGLCEGQANTLVFRQDSGKVSVCFITNLRW